MSRAELNRARYIEVIVDLFGICQNLSVIKKENIYKTLVVIFVMRHVVFIRYSDGGHFSLLPAAM